MYAAIGGIDIDSDQHGYKHIVIRPQPGGGLTHASAELQSRYGTIKSGGRLEGGNFVWSITVTENTAATIYVPAKELSEIREGERLTEHTEGVTFLKMENGSAVFGL